MTGSNESYYDLNDHDQDKAVAYLLKSLLKGRAQLSGNPALKEGDEDVNVYLAHLMFAVTTPRYRNIAERYLSPYAGDVNRMIDEANDYYIKYFIYKVNADHLLVHLGIFQDLGEEAPRSHAIFTPNEQQYCGRATSYYDQAAHFNHRIYRKETAVGTVLGKLAEDFDLYRDLLRITRRDFMHFTNTSTDEQFAHFVKQLGEFEKFKKLQSMQDEFLDLYGAWLKTRSGELHGKIIRLSQDINKVDPDFHFEMPS